MHPSDNPNNLAMAPRRVTNVLTVYVSLWVAALVGAVGAWGENGVKDGQFSFIPTQQETEHIRAPDACCARNQSWRVV